jgi:SHS2 domain-containing protein
VDEGGAEATVAFARYDPERHGEGMDVKAVTWHAARLEREGDGWVAQVVLDV